jgi:hypothetical protein
VRIGTHVGDAERMCLRVMHFRTTEDDEVVVPNSVILGLDVVTTQCRGNRGLIQHTTVGAGYERRSTSSQTPTGNGS